MFSFWNAIEQVIFKKSMYIKIFFTFLDDTKDNFIQSKFTWVKTNQNTVIQLQHEVSDSETTETIIFQTHRVC